MMKQEKQNLVLEILGNGRYRVDADRGVLQSFLKTDQVWRDLISNKLPTGYLQHRIHLGRGKNVSSVVYLHVIVWLSVHGTYEEGMVLGHIDSNPSNCRIDNLRLVSHSQNILESVKNRPVTSKYTKVIRSKEISEIRRLCELGYSQSAIARSLDLNRTSVRYVVKKNESGEKLKFEKA